MIMNNCYNCGCEVNANDTFCNQCGAQLNTQAQNVSTQDMEQEFLDNTYRLLKWERVAWSIVSKFLIIFGAIFGALFFVLGLVFLFIEAPIGVMYLLYAFFYGAVFIALGIVGKKAADRINYYLDRMYTDASETFTRCSSIGMLIFNVTLGSVSPIFFIINFVRIRSNAKIVESIVAKQRGNL